MKRNHRLIIFTVFSFQALSTDREHLAKFKSVIKDLHKSGNSKLNQFVEFYYA